MDKCFNNINNDIIHSIYCKITIYNKMLYKGKCKSYPAFMVLLIIAHLRKLFKMHVLYNRRIFYYSFLDWIITTQMKHHKSWMVSWERLQKPHVHSTPRLQERGGLLPQFLPSRAIWYRWLMMVWCSVLVRKWQSTTPIVLHAPVGQPAHLWYGLYYESI